MQAPGGAVVKHSRSFFCGIFFAVVLIFSSQSFAQWNKIAANAFPGLTSSGGMLQFKNGVLWGGNTSVSYSLDTGKTWTVSLASMPSGERVMDIDFFDDQTGLIRTGTLLYITTNHGATWSSQTVPGSGGSRYSAVSGTARQVRSLDGNVA